MSAVDYKVSAMLSDERSHRGSGTAQPCYATLSVYPGFEHLTADVLAELDSTLPVGMENRQFLPEVFLLDFMLAHPCRLAHESRIPTRQVLGSSVVPHFYVIPVLWRAISYLPSCTNSSAKACVMTARARILCMIQTPRAHRQIGTGYKKTYIILSLPNLSHYDNQKHYEFP